MPDRVKLTSSTFAGRPLSGPSRLFRRKPEEKKPEKNKPELKSKNPGKEKASVRMANFQRKYLEAKKKQEEMDRR